MSVQPSGNRRSRVSRGGNGEGNTSKKTQGPRRKNPTNSNTSELVTDESLDDSEVCIICANKLIYAALSPCIHTVCHVCAFRQRALYEKKACLVCRTECDRMIITEQIDKTFNDFSDASSFECHDPKYNIDFTSSYAYKDTLGLLDFSCKVCNETFPSFKTLSEHVKNEHHKYFCLICSHNRKAFVSELKLYNFKQLQKHQGEGDEQGFFGHPECKHCRGKRFYSEDELNIHIRDHHERCHICDQNNPKTADYYKNYDSLFQHFRVDHYVCNFPICLEKKFVVFREELDLTAHMLKEHGGIASGSKVIIGATGRQYQSQLSTFSGIGETSLSANRSNNSKGFDDADSFDTKKKRLEERAKHYLNYNNTSIKAFQKLNANFRSKNISAKELLKNYEELFTKQTPEEINLLIYEMAELFPEHSQERKSLSSISEELVVNNSKERFPMLNGSGSSSTASIHSWTGNGIRKSSPNNNELFPALAKPKKASGSPSLNQPIRYSKVVRKIGSPSPSSSSSSTPVNFKPTYLNKNTSPSVDSLPVLGGGSKGNSSTSLSNDNGILQPKPTTSSSSSTILSNSKFPSLEKKSNKKPIPRVNPVITPTSWGPSSNTIRESKPAKELDFGIQIIAKKKKNGNR
ncbi:E3 ubiquitin-protein ligase Hel2p [[Candida] railenensis]|uniref:RING-type E3 ubiquitin transferase n=1 Tax=[Candida] railenensis TaxID=45579 RepID=A0A9P0VWF7_9ASCO|nr:E3 ubiquitin-protein ligase Hel2p [[Candida] railenensis]